ncbi:sensor histidine kinase [Nitriliruptor alkaliphilus]|uniref:sensor histidine kinase n=1 Tax=Nitriliruptor alkaliphilus TaxID=427918 RepID=UPI0006965D45|nr:ATP-binding protein [Nitriliruptor alkaliphilus]
MEGALPWVVALLVVVGFAAAAVARERRRVRRLADHVGGWLGDEGHQPVRLGDGGAWGELGTALNALGAGYERRGAKLARERPWRRELVDALVDPALLFSSEGRLLAANDAARDLLAIPIDAADVTVTQAVGSPALAGAVQQVQASGEAVTVDAEHGEHDLRAVVARVGDETLLLVNDRTRERRVEELRRNFVVNASHELKTPVTAIKTLSEALAVTVDTDPARTKQLLRRLDLESERLARLVYDLLDLRQLEERGPLERVPVDLAELARQTVVGALERAEERGIDLSVEAPDRAFVAGVGGDLQVIVKNLVGNAIQYNVDGGRVVVSLDAEEGAHVLRVSDTGIGIPQQDLSRVFERFYRVDTARSRETGGTGLGLSIVRHAVEKHGGTISVDSLLGEGTTFTVTLPIEAPQ